jgi:hypothetical protein
VPWRRIRAFDPAGRPYLRLLRLGENQQPGGALENEGKVFGGIFEPSGGFHRKTRGEITSVTAGVSFARVPAMKTGWVS